MSAKRGRPTVYTQELSDRLCALLSDGQSLRKVCESDEFPCKTTIFMWLRTNEEFLNQYTKAKEESADSHVDGMIDDVRNIGSPVIDDDGKPVMVDGKPLMVVDSTAINHARLIYDVQKWTASKLKSKMYGDKLQNEHTGPGGGPIKTVALDPELYAETRKKMLEEDDV